MHVYRILTGDQSLTAATAKTVAQLVTGATRRAKILTVETAFSSVTSTEAPVLIELLLQTTAGTMSAATPAIVDQADPAAISTAQITATAEPTASTILWAERVTPVGGTAVFVFPRDEQITMAVSTRVGLRMTSAASQSNVRAVVTFQE